MGSSSAGLDMCLDPARCELVVRDALAKSNATGQVPMLSGLPNVSLAMGVRLGARGSCCHEKGALAFKDEHNVGLMGLLC